MTFERLQSRLGALGRKAKITAGVAGLGRTVQAVVAAAAVTFLLDRTLHLPRGVRAVLLIGAAASVAVVFVRRFLRPVGRRMDLDELALQVERSDPELNDLLISAVQLRRDLESGRTTESPELIRATIDRSLEAAAARSFGSAVSAKPAVKPAAIAVLGAVAIGTAAALRPDAAALWLRRDLLLQDAPWPKATDLEIVIVDSDKFAATSTPDRVILSVPERTPLQVQVIAHGDVPSEVELVAAPVDKPDETTAFAMGRPGGKGWFQHVFPPLTRSVLLYATGGDDQDRVPLYEIRVARAPRVQRFWIDYEYPEYVGRPKASLPDANVSAPEGTKLTIRFEVNMPLLGFDLDFEKQGRRPLTPLADGTYSYAFTLDQSDFYTYRLHGENGVNSVDAPRYVLTAEPDQPPRIQVEMPAQTGIVCTPDAIIPVRGAAVDDYGVTSLSLRHGGAEGPLAAESEFAAGDVLKPFGGREVPFYRDLKAADFGGPLKAGDKRRFKLLATDNRRTAAHPEPHRQFGDYEYSMTVLAAGEVERELAQRQTRLRDRVRDILGLAEARLTETQDALRDAGGDSAAPGAMGRRLSQIELGQNRITSELVTTTRQFLRIFEGYLYNRLDPGNLTEKLLAVLSGIYKTTTESDPFKIYGEALAGVRPQATESELMGRLTVILDLFVRCAAEKSPEAARRIAQANLVQNPSDRAELTRGAEQIERALVEDLRSLEEKLEAWEDYLDVVQGLKDLIDLQKGVRAKTEKLTK